MKDITNYSKKSQGNDSWAKLKEWKDPMGGRGAPNVANGTSGVGVKGTKVPGGLNKPSDSKA